MPDTSSGAIFEDLVYNDLVVKGFVESNTRLASNYNKILIMIIFIYFLFIKYYFLL